MIGLILSVWIIFALIVGAVASRKGFSFRAYFFHGLFPTFITALITLSIADKFANRLVSERLA